ncbi:endoglucanase [Kineothrix alysoides]|uniref:cellulase n=1 Tax=Kineothrix alysoides TaxID=1469948 RepID=A0A4R1R176_9FIRM|nr:glycoside hydrolase family 5 protein [Kineothrix alysoides]TCL59076.1 endoglucanase [Kineothrix alysoides]
MGDVENKNVKIAGTTPVERYGALSVKGNQLVDRNGNAVALRGVSTHGLSWYPQYVNQESFRFMRDEWGIEVVRLAMYTAEENGYCVGDDDNRQMLKDVIHKGVLAAADLGLYVIIDWHILSDGNPNQNKEQSLAFFKESSKRYQEYDNVIYEICNEPNGDVDWPEIKAYADEVIPVIRQNDEDAIILVGTPTWSQEVDKAQVDPITGYDNLMYVLHFYADTHREELRSKLKLAHDGGRPIFVSEFGICDASGSGAVNVEEADKWIELLESHSISYIAWNLSNKEETSAFFKVSCTKTTDYDCDDLSESAKWFIQMK